MYWKAGLLALVLVVCSVHAKDEEVDDGVINVKVLGRSGKIAVCQKENNSTKRKGKCIVLEFDQIMENDEDGNKVSCQKHFLQNMAQTDFVVSDKVDMEFQNLSVSHFNFSTKMQSDKATFTAMLYIFKENGSYTFGNDEVSVIPGDVKVNVEIEDWTWCGTEAGDEAPKKNGAKPGKFLDVTVTVKGPKGDKPKKKPKGSGGKPDKPEEITTKDGKKRHRKYRKANKNTDDVDMGDGTSMVLSRYYKAKNGSATEMREMPSGYPKLETQGSKSKTIYRFGKVKSVMYDPTLQVADIDPEAESQDDNAASSVVVSAVLIIACLFFGQ